MTTEPDRLEVLAAVAAWARPFLALADVPEFGTATWAALPLDDVRRSAAVVRAALSWWRVGDPAEVLEQRAAAALHVLTSHSIADAEHWSSLAYRPTPAELAHARDWQARAVAAA